MRFLSIGQTDRGKIRPKNEDAFFISSCSGTLETHPAFFTADGLGGQVAGEIASGLAVQAAADFLHDSTLPSPENLKQAFIKANEAVLASQRIYARWEGMATTLVALLLNPQGAWVGNIGDSRAYRLRPGYLEQISVDHSYVQELIDAGALSSIEARLHPYRNVITRTIGSDENIEADIFPLDLQPYDLFLLATDGLFGVIDDGEISQLLAEVGVGEIDEGNASPGLETLEHCGNQLIRAALRAGGPDNITLVLVQILPDTPA